MAPTQYQPRSRATTRSTKQASKHPLHKLVPLVVVLIALIGGAVYVWQHHNPKTSAAGTTTHWSLSTTSASQTANHAPSSVNACGANTLPQLVLVSVSQRHMWACQRTTAVYSSAVVTGIAYLAADLTPTGTYHIYAKQTNQTLSGCDSTGCWNDHVFYWMPFLENQYGIYGFHDATWRATNAFGNIDPNSANASHGCVEIPLAASQWLYNWAQIGTTVTIQS